MSTMKEMKTHASWEASVTGLCNSKLNYISSPYEHSGGMLTQFGDAPLRLLSCFESGRKLIKVCDGFCKLDCLPSCLGTLATNNEEINSP